LKYDRNALRSYCGQISICISIYNGIKSLKDTDVF